MGINRKPFEGSKLNRKPRKDEPGFREQERRLADAIPGGKLTPGSGSGSRPSRKSDAVGTYFRGEGKTTANRESITIYKGDLRKVEIEAMQTRKIPHIIFGFDAAPQTKDPNEYLPPQRYDWIAFPRETAKRMMQVIDALLQGDQMEAALAAVEMVRP